jgi:O-antigen/teichoic acid export membrane protein
MTAGRVSLKINAVSQWFALVLELAVGLTLTPLIVRYLGKEGYGTWMLLVSVFGYYGILTLGIDSAVMRFLARHLARGERDEATSVLSTATVGLATVGVVIAAAALLFGDALAGFLEVDPGHREDFVRLVHVLSFATLGTFLSSIAAAALKAREYFVPVNLIMGAASLARAGVTIALLQMGWGLTGVATGMAAAILLRVLCMGTVALRRLEGVAISWRHVRWSTMRTLLAFGLGGTLLMVGAKLRFSLDGMVIAKTLDLAQVGVFAVAASVLRYVNSMVSVGISVLAPRFTTLDAEGDREGLVALFLRSIRVASEFSLGVCAVVATVGGAFITWWVGEGFEESVHVLWILVAGMAPVMLQNPGISLFYATDRHRTYAIINLVEGATNLGLSILLVRSLGLAGVALGTTIPLLVNKLLITPWYTTRILGIGQGRYWRPAAPSAIASVITVAVSRALWWTPLEGLPALADLVARSLATGAVYVAACWLVARTLRQGGVEILDIAVAVIRRRRQRPEAEAGP